MCSARPPTEASRLPCIRSLDLVLPTQSGIAPVPDPCPCPLLHAANSRSFLSHSCRSIVISWLIPILRPDRHQHHAAPSLRGSR
eukprot:766858-Hanusia_phi.AAC.7